MNANIICGEEDQGWLLSYLNSSLVTFLVRGVLLRSNMITSGYVSRIPLVPFSDEDRRKLSEISLQAITTILPKESYKSIISEIDYVVFSAAGISESSVCLVDEFCRDLLRRT